MGLFIDCHFLFEVQLLCLNSIFCHLKIVSGAVDARKGVPSDEIGTFPSYSSLFRAQPFLYFPYVSLKTPFLVTSNDTEWEGSILFTSQSMASKQRCTHGHPLIFVALA